MPNIYEVKNKKFYITEFGCYETMSAASRPTVRVGGKVMSLMKFIYEECFGEIPEGLLIRHKCDNSFCINPEHLELGTHKDNMHDLYLKRKYKDRPSRHMLSGEEISRAKYLHENEGLSLMEIAKKMDFPYSSVYIAFNQFIEEEKVSEENVSIAKYFMNNKGMSLEETANFLKVSSSSLEKALSTKVSEGQKRKAELLINQAKYSIEEAADLLKVPLIDLKQALSKRLE